MIETGICEKRLLKRANDETLSLAIDLTYPKDTSIIKHIEEISEKGLSFKTFEYEGYFQKGSILKDIKIFNNEYESIIPASEVMYCKSYKTEGLGQYKIGIKFLENQNQKRPKRSHFSTISHTLPKVSFKLNEEEFRAELINFSKYGLCLSIAQPRFVAKKSDLLKDINIKINEDIVYSANGVIVSIEQNNNNLEIGVSLQEKTIPINQILTTSIKDKINFSYNLFKSDLHIKDSVSIEFQNMVQNFYYFLKNLEINLTQFEKSIQKESLSIQQNLSKEMLNFLEEKIFKDLDEHMKILNDFINNVPKEQYDNYKLYYQKLLHPFYLQSPFLNRVYHKPLGYAGDYEMMNMIYANKPKGKTLFSKFIDKYLLSIDPAQTNRNRIPYMMNKLKKHIPEYLKTNKRIKIASIACGPCLEIQSLLKQEKTSDYVDFTLFDVDKGALDCANQRLDILKNKYDRKTTFKYVNQSIFPLIKKEDVRNQIEDGQHIIYSLGLFEYLSDITVKKLIKVLFQKLAPNGLLIIGNYATSNNFQAYMEVGGEWFLFYREAEKMLSFTKELQNTKIYIDDDGQIDFNKFLNIKKTEG